MEVYCQGSPGRRQGLHRIHSIDQWSAVDRGSLYQEAMVSLLPINIPFVGRYGRKWQTSPISLSARRRTTRAKTPSRPIHIIRFIKAVVLPSCYLYGVTWVVEHAKLLFPFHISSVFFSLSNLSISFNALNFFL